MELEELVKKNPPRESLGILLQPVEFEKDDDTNFHVAYVTACSNLRATNWLLVDANVRKMAVAEAKLLADYYSAN